MGEFIKLMVFELLILCLNEVVGEGQFLIVLQDQIDFLF